MVETSCDLSHFSRPSVTRLIKLYTAMEVEERPSHLRVFLPHPEDITNGLSLLPTLIDLFLPVVKTVAIIAADYENPPAVLPGGCDRLLGEAPRLEKVCLSGIYLTDEHIGRQFVNALNRPGSCFRRLELRLAKLTPEFVRNVKLALTQLGKHSPLTTVDVHWPSSDTSNISVSRQTALLLDLCSAATTLRELHVTSSFGYLPAPLPLLTRVLEANCQLEELHCPMERSTNAPSNHMDTLFQALAGLPGLKELWCPRLRSANLGDLLLRLGRQKSPISSLTIQTKVSLDDEWCQHLRYLGNLQHLNVKLDVDENNPQCLTFLEAFSRNGSITDGIEFCTYQGTHIFHSGELARILRRNKTLRELKVFQSSPEWQSPQLWPSLLAGYGQSGDSSVVLDAIMDFVRVKFETLLQFQERA